MCICVYVHVLEVDNGLLEEGDEDRLGVRELGHQLDLQAQQALDITMIINMETPQVHRSGAMPGGGVMRWHLHGLNNVVHKLSGLPPALSPLQYPAIESHGPM